MNQADNSTSELRQLGGLSTEINVLECKANRWKLVYLTWNTVMYQDSNSASHE